MTSSRTTTSIYIATRIGVNFFNSLFNFILVFEFFCLGSNIIQIIILFWIHFEDALCIFKILQEQHQIDPFLPIGKFKKRWILLTDSQFGIFFSCSSNIRPHQVLLYVHSKCVGVLNVHPKYGGSCSILSCRRLEQHNWLHDVNRAALTIFWMRIEQNRICLEQL